MTAAFVGLIEVDRDRPIDLFVERRNIFELAGAGSDTAVIVVDVGEGLVVVVNPTIFNEEGEAQMEEGCLCLPGVLVDVKRSERVTVKGLDEKGQEVTIEAEGLFARALQNEIEYRKA